MKCNDHQIIKKHLIFFISIHIFLISGICQDANNIKLKDYRPISIYRLPNTKVIKAKYPVIHFNSHNYLKSDDAVNYICQLAFTLQKINGCMKISILLMMD